LVHASAYRFVPDCRIRLDGRLLPFDKGAALTRAEVDLDADLFGQCVLTFNDPNLRLIDGTDFASGVRVEVEMGFHTRLERVFDGEVVALEPQFRRDLPPSLKVVCLERLHRLALTPRTRAFNAVDDRQIVTNIAREYGLTGQAPAGTSEHILQSNTTDAVFLRRMAQKQGFHLRIEDRNLVVGPPPRGRRMTIGPGAGVRKMTVHVDSRSQVSEVSVHGWDPNAKREIVATARPDPGEVGDGARQHGGGSTIFIAGHEHAPSDVATAEKMARGRMRKLAEAFVKAQVEMIGDPELVPGQVVEFDKMGAQLDGSYRIEHARHAFNKHGYFVTFKAVRIAKKPFQSQTQAFQPQPTPKLSDPQWDMQSYPNGAVAKVQVKAVHLEGGSVRFLIEQHLGGSSWKPIAEKIATVSQGVAKTTIPIPEAVYLSKPRWTMDTHVHGDEGTMIVDARGIPDGRKVHFIVETEDPETGDWEPADPVEALVDGERAQATLRLAHPGSDSTAADQEPRNVRFRAEIDTDQLEDVLRFRAEIV
jgi:phage protein D